MSRQPITAGSVHQRHPTQPAVEHLEEHVVVDVEPGDGSGDAGAGGRVEDTNRNERLVRFREYSKRALLYEFPLATTLLMPRTDSVVASTSAKVGSALLCTALFVDLMGSVYLELVSRRRRVIRESTCRWHGVRIYASGVLLMSMPFCLLLSLNVLYAFLAVALAPLLAVVWSLLLKEHRSLESEANRSYDPDCDGKLKHQFDASAAVNTIATGAGLIGTFFGYSSNFTPDRHVTVSESLLFLTIVGGQFVMVVTTARPAFRKASSPASLAAFLGLLVASLPVLLSISALAGAVDFLGGLALLGFSLDFFELVIFFVATFCSETDSRSTSSEPCEPATGRNREADAPGAALEGKQLLWLVFMFVYFTALVALYQKQTGKNPQMFDKARILLYFTAFCCCSLHGDEGKLPLLPAMDLPRNHHWWLGLARSAVMGLAALDWILRYFYWPN